MDKHLGQEACDLMDAYQDMLNRRDPRHGMSLDQLKQYYAENGRSEKERKAELLRKNPMLAKYGYHGEV